MASLHVQVVRLHLPNSAHLANIDAFLRGFDPAEPGELHVSIHERWVSVHPFALAFTACLAAACRGHSQRADPSVSGLPHPNGPLRRARYRPWPGNHRA